MTSDRIRELYFAKPFRPFTLHLADGTKTRVNSPEFMMLTPGGRTLVVGHGDDELDIIDLPLVTKVSAGSRKRPPGANGR
jgi:hypothetical protein